MMTPESQRGQVPPYPRSPSGSPSGTAPLGGNGDTHSAARGRQTPAEWASEEAASPSGPAVPFFWHTPPRPTKQLSNSTRYLCTAAYLDRLFANRVIWELIASRRAVAPSVDIDVGPVIRHCLHARKITLVRDATLTACLALGLIVQPMATITFLVIALILGVVLPRAPWRHLGLAGKFVGAACAVFLCVAVCLVAAVGTFLATLLSTGGSLAAALAGEVSPAIALAALLAAAGLAQYSYMHSAFRVLTGRRRAGATPPRPADSATEARIAAVEAAQWGNITLYGGENPFIGTGPRPERSWSIAVELERAQPGRSGQPHGSRSRRPVVIDSVELHAAIRERLRRLNDPNMPPNERISGLSIDDALVGPGLLRWTSPLLDVDGQLPYSQASPEAIGGMIRHPQAALRYYQRVTVSDEGSPAYSGGRRIIDGVDQGIAVSAFVYVAVEGGMLYVQFVRTALPPIRHEYRITDLMSPMTPEKFQATVIWQSGKSLFSAVIYSPIGIYSAIRLRWREKKFEATFSPAERIDLANFGAQLSIRELAAGISFDTHMQQLDVEKYSRIIERRLVDTVLDFLADRGIDTSAFASTATSVINGDVINVGNVTGGKNQWGRENTFNETVSPGAH